jgi:ankyrin repeat/BTB/POZ domain-containing protein 1
MAHNFEAFASSAAFQAMVKALPPLTEFVDATIRPNKPEVAVPRGTEEKNEESTNVLEDLREKWLEIEGGDGEERDKHAAEFDRRMNNLRNMEAREPSDS